MVIIYKRNRNKNNIVIASKSFGKVCWSEAISSLTKIGFLRSCFAVGSLSPTQPRNDAVVKVVYNYYKNTAEKSERRQKIKV